ncbi:AraC family transcriptional regulator [Trebonia kvetii]|uniref:AraC family transcriptional regulator n=1 Tax=Trebonia kvetii TaxID=2480626 RepID=A0A6P2BM75_9ACTN|nr:AraC family transcriptional regulator [Trebonia kvetii]TVZ00052.1 AraC family transcriptional regulator [Trebonia kvetii]
MPVTAAGATAQADLVPRVFSTAGLPAARRVELWETHNASALIGLDVRAASPLEAVEVNVQLPHARLARVRGSAHEVARTHAVISRSPAGSVAVYLTLRGEAWFTSADGTRQLRPGDALVCATDRPFARGFAHGLDELVVTVPWDAVSTRADVSLPEGQVVTSFATEADQHARALARLTGRATRADQPVPPDDRTVLDLVAVLAAGRDAARATAHRAAAHLYIEEHLTDPGLGADRIAAAIGISERQLSRVFAADCTSVPRHILERRLLLARSVLSATGAAARAATGATGAAAGQPMTVAEAAARCGFTSAAYFSHAFRQHFGLSASDVRRSAAGGSF